MKKSDPWGQRQGSNTPREHESRSEWERDFARIIHSPSFRRLQGKTQVLGMGDSDFYRTRLTHSMEVAQVSAALVSNIKKRLREKDSFTLRGHEYSASYRVCSPAGCPSEQRHRPGARSGASPLRPRGRGGPELLHEKARRL